MYATTQFFCETYCVDIFHRVFCPFITHVLLDIPMDFREKEIKSCLRVHCYVEFALLPEITALPIGLVGSL